MKKLIKKFGILFLIFLAAVTAYFIWSQRPGPKVDVMVYTSMDEASLPVVYTEMYGRETNILHGYLQDMKQTVARESLTILPEDRALPIRVSEYDGNITGISYEIRSLDLERLVERTELTDWTSGQNGVAAILPIQNLLTRNETYLLTLNIDTEAQGSVRYYTRIMWADKDRARDMIDFALDFSKKTFDYDQARELVTYLETNAAEDNSSLGHVTIRSSFSQLTWGGLQMVPEGEFHVTLKEMDGIMANVEVWYRASRGDESGGREIYEVVDNYTLKWDAKRLYLMDFDRKTDQIFSGRKELFSGKRILLGITNDSEVRVEKSPDENFLVFTANRDLWEYDQNQEQAVKIFSFRSGKDDGIKSDYNKHGIKVLSVNDEGDVEFLVYGYMNRGNREGYMGIALYRYTGADNAIKEILFIPVMSSFEEIKEDVEELAHLGDNGLLYLLVGQAAYGIDLNSKEYLVLADALQTGAYSVSASENRLVWQEGEDLYSSGLLHVMNLDSGDKHEINGEAGELMRVLGFVGDDLVYGIARQGEQWVKNGRFKELPMFRINIMDLDGAIQNQYEGEGTYIADVSIEDARIHLNQVNALGGQSYLYNKGDTIVCNQSLGKDPLDGVGWYADQLRRKLYFIQIGNEINSSRNIKVSTPKKVTYESSEILELRANADYEGMIFYAYGGGRYLGSSWKFSEAVSMAYEKMGIVVGKNQKILWDRVNRSPIKNIKDPEESAASLVRYLGEFQENGIFEDKILILDGLGCSAGQMLYFIDKGCPVVAYTGEGSYVLLTGYDQYNIFVYNPADKTTEKMGLNDAGERFDNLGNDFFCGLFLE